MELNLDGLFGRADRPQAPSVRIENAVMALVAGLESFVGKPEETEGGQPSGGYTWIPAYDAVAAWMQDNRRKGLLLVGGNGTGKTTMERILKRILDRYFNTEADIVNRCAFTSASSMDEAWSRYCRYQIIDDVGKEPATFFYGKCSDLLSQIVDRAEQRGQLLICSTNLEPQELVEKYGLRTMDRMNSIMQAVFFSGESFRQRKPWT